MTTTTSTKKCVAIRKIDRKRLEDRWMGGIDTAILRAATAFMGYMMLRSESPKQETQGRPAGRQGAQAGTGRRSKPKLWIQSSLSSHTYTVLDTVADVIYHRNPKAKCFRNGKRMSYALIVAYLTHVKTDGLLALAAYARTKSYSNEFDPLEAFDRQLARKRTAWMLPLYIRDHGLLESDYIELDPYDHLELDLELA